MPNNNHSLLFLGKADDSDCARALEFCQKNFAHVTFCLGKWGDPLPDEIRKWEGDYIISYLSRWVVPEELLSRAKKAAINFHPASPEYPGIGCNNFALYENAKEYGATCHHMATKVDTGKIIAVKRFPIYPEDDVAALLKRTYENQMALFFEIAQLMADGKELPVSSEKWTRPPFTRKQFNELFVIKPDMSKDEIARRVRAISYGDWQPYFVLEGLRFEYKPGDPAVIQAILQNNTRHTIELRIFLSYASQDREVVLKLYKRLKRDGFSPWLDKKNILPGKDWEHEIIEAIRNSHVIVVCLSHVTSDKQGMIQKEIRQALDIYDEQPEGSIFLIPLRLEDCMPPPRLARFQWVDYFEKEGYTLLLKSLEARIKELQKYNDLF